MGKKKKATTRRASGSWSSFASKPKGEETTTDVGPKPASAAPRTTARTPALAASPPPKRKVGPATAERYVVPEKRWLPLDTIADVKGAWGIVASPTTPEVYGTPLGVVNGWKERIKDRAAELKFTVGAKGRKRRG